MGQFTGNSLLWDIRKNHGFRLRFSLKPIHSLKPSEGRFEMFWNSAFLTFGASKPWAFHGEELCGLGPRAAIGSDIDAWIKIECTWESFRRRFSTVSWFAIRPPWRVRRSYSYGRRADSRSNILGREGSWCWVCSKQKKTLHINDGMIEWPHVTTPSSLFF